MGVSGSGTSALAAREAGRAAGRWTGPAKAALEGPSRSSSDQRLRTLEPVPSRPLPGSGPPPARPAARRTVTVGARSRMGRLTYRLVGLTLFRSRKHPGRLRLRPGHTDP